jgi:ATP-dependent Clp protease ATP-binding subunit ClpX
MTIIPSSTCLHRVGIIHIDEIDKLSRRGAGDGTATWSGGRDVGGEGVQQAFLRLLEGTTISLNAKPPISSGPIGGDPAGAGGKKGVREGLPGFSGAGGSGELSLCA